MTNIQKGMAEFKEIHNKIIAILKTKNDEFLAEKVDYRDFNFRFLLHGLSRAAVEQALLAVRRQARLGEQVVDAFLRGSVENGRDCLEAEQSGRPLREPGLRANLILARAQVAA